MLQAQRSCGAQPAQRARHPRAPAAAPPRLRELDMAAAAPAVGVWQGQARAPPGRMLLMRSCRCSPAGCTHMQQLLPLMC